MKKTVEHNITSNSSNEDAENDWSKDIRTIKSKLKTEEARIQMRNPMLQRHKPELIDNSTIASKTGKLRLDEDQGVQEDELVNSSRSKQLEPLSCLQVWSLF